ncbi:MAG: YihY family inner membrane protein [Gallionella sp.]|nr:YihY family inner membrane protein [Gallionella sp.]
MQKTLDDLVAFVRLVTLRFGQDRCAQIAASLSFTTLLSMVPLVTIALTLFSAFPVFEGFSAQIKSFLLSNLMPEMAGKVITGYMVQFADSAMQLRALGIALLVVTAILLLLTIEKAFNTIWQVTRSRPLLKRLVIYWALLTLAPLLIGASLALTSWLVGLSMGYARHVPVFGVEILKLLPLFLTTLAFFFLFHSVPNRHVRRIHALIGAVIAALLFESMNRLFGYYISHFPTYKLVYGAFASVPIFLMWIYLSWLTILLGAVITAAMPYWRMQTAVQHSTTVRFLDGLRVLRALSEGLQQGKANTFDGLVRSLHLGHDMLEGILEKLEEADMVRSAEGGCWLLLRDAAHIRVAEVLRLFVLDGSELASTRDDEPLRGWLNGYIARIEQNADLTLQELFAHRAA